MALVITRKQGQRTIIADENGVVIVEITSLDLERGKHRFGIKAPQQFRIFREEIAPPEITKQLSNSIVK